MNTFAGSSPFAIPTVLPLLSKGAPDFAQACRKWVFQIDENKQVSSCGKMEHELRINNTEGPHF